MATKTALLFALAFVSQVASHGYLRELQADGKTCHGYSPNYHPDSLAGCMYKVPTTTDNGFVDWRYYGTRDMICHKGAQSDKYTLKVKAGSTITGTFTIWPESHHGPIIDSISKCDGECKDADLTKQKFDVVSHSGLLHPRPGVPDGTYIDGNTAGYWALDDFRDNGSIIKFTVPKCLKPGNYIWRHEMIALHSAMPEAKTQGAQHYPYCINIEVTGDGTQEPTGGSSPMNWYSRADPGITINIYRNPTKYIIPGPDVSFTCGVNDQPTTPDNNTPLSITTATTLAAASTTTLAAATNTPDLGITDKRATTTVAYPYQNLTVSATSSPTPISTPISTDTTDNTGNTENMAKTDNTGNTDTMENTGNTDNTGKTDNSSTPTSKVANAENTGTPTPKTYTAGTTGNTDKTDNTDKNDNVVKPTSSTVVADIIKQLQTALDELRKALNIPSSKMKRRHAREVVVGA